MTGRRATPGESDRAPGDASEVQGPVLCALVKAIIDRRDLNQICRVLGEYLRPYVHFDRLGVSIASRHNHEIHQLVALITSTDTKQALGVPVPIAGSDLEWVMVERRHQLVHDLTEDRRFTTDEFLWIEGMRSILRLPLFHGDEVIGLLFLNDRAPGAYGERELALMEPIADLVAVAVKSAQLQQEAILKANEITALHGVALDVATSDLPTLLQTLVERAVRLLQALGGCFYLLNSDFDALELTAGYNLCKADCLGSFCRIGEGLAGQVALSKKPVIISDYGNWRGRSSQCQDAPVAVAVGVPVKQKEAVIGVIVVFDDQESHRFTPEAMRLLDTLAYQASTAITGARLYQEVRQRLAEAQRVNRWMYALHEVTTMAQDALNLQEVLERIVWGIVQGLNYGAALLFSFDMKEQVVQVRAVAADPELVQGAERIVGARLVGYSFEMKNPNSSLAQAMHKGEILTGNSLVEMDKAWLSDQVAAELEGFLGYSGYTFVPLIARGQLLGALFLVGEPEAVTERDVELLQIFAVQAALVIENAMILDELNRWNIRLEETVIDRTRELTALHALATAMSSSFDLDEIFSRATEQVAEALHTKAAAIFLPDGEPPCWRLRAHYGLSPETLEGMEARLSDLESREPPDLISEEAGRGSYQSWAEVPLSYRGERYGVLAVMDVAPDRFRSQDIELLQTIGQQLVQAIENAGLYQSVESERAYRESIINSLEDGLVVVDLQGVQTDVNPAFCAMTGFSRRELVGKKQPFPYCPDDEGAEALRTAMQGDIRELGTPLEVNLCRRSGEVFPALLTISSLRDADDRMHGYLLVVRDMTEIKLIQQQVMRASRLASIGQLAAGVAHQVNNPLSTALICIQLAMDSLTAEQAGGSLGKYLRTIEAETERAAGIVRDLLTFSRQREPYFTRVDLGQVLRRIGVVAYTSLAMAQIDLILDISQNLPHILADEQQLEQLFFGLIFNARDAVGKDGRVCICVSPEGERVRVIVADTGPGISPEVMPHLFEPFFTTKGIDKGMGMGLPIAHGIVESHGGSISVESPIRKETALPSGRYRTAFIIHFPAAVDRGDG